MYIYNTYSHISIYIYVYVDILYSIIFLDLHSTCSHLEQLKPLIAFCTQRLNLLRVNLLNHVQSMFACCWNSDGWDVSGHGSNITTIIGSCVNVRLSTVNEW